MHERDKQTDRRTDTGPEQRPRLRIASPGNQWTSARRNLNMIVVVVVVVVVIVDL